MIQFLFSSFNILSGVDFLLYAVLDDTPVTFSTSLLFIFLLKLILQNHAGTVLFAVRLRGRKRVMVG